jgi:hypothetical protein
MLPFFPITSLADDAIVPGGAQVAHVPMKSLTIVLSDECSVSFSAKYAVNMDLILRILKLFSA